MKKITIKLLCFFCLLSIVIACTSSDTAEITPDPKPDAGELPKDVVSDTSSFEISFFQQTNAVEKQTENVFVSPLSLKVALAMLLNGADGNTAQEIKRTLKHQNLSMLEINALYNNLIANAAKIDEKVQIEIANSVWYSNDFAVEPSFLSVLQNSFQAEATALNFRDKENSKNQINQWVSQKTRNKINKIIDQIQPEEVMFLINAVYFKADWLYNFDPTSTQDQPFTLIDQSRANVKMMQQQASFSYASRNGYRAVVLPYGKGNFNLTILLPNAEKNINEFIKEYTLVEWKALQENMKTQKVNLSLPKFTLEYEKNLNQILQSMGIKEAFGNKANLSKISKTQGLYVTQVKQKTFVQIDEKGTEAAAVTSIGVGTTSFNPNDPIFFVCNSPFVVVLTEKQHNTILFMGKIAKPEVK